MVASGGNYVSMCKNIILYMCIYLYVYIMNIPFLDTQSARFVYHCFAYFRAPTSHEQSFFWGGQRSHTIDFFIRSGEVLRFQANTSEVEQRVYPSKKKVGFDKSFRPWDGQFTGTMSCLCKNIIIFKQHLGKGIDSLFIFQD